ncbi:L-serine ammonia-lyase [Larsenimonas rhizosphaerae]|uniref:L-serine dehydratase n=1 Tax=Larsenimonas rhizosphaerae TaxID=2944682 RepID=A0AA41ZQE5_9GAMM|nr:L-serine ammonia-lyase [Larsenimonas rhizosphaerae]MCM2131206.1 L-serine ammonia-lyase [Larsenimonas rhizosphaerae]MCX2525435.1 L-serine ammonia-lyase [Larsenimonas rhizosphaerae]
MPISVFELFKIGVGPSSSHTVGPMQAAHDYLQELRDRHLVGDVARITVKLFGSLSSTGIGHGTDRAVIMGLMGERPDSINPEVIAGDIDTLLETRQLLLGREQPVRYIWDEDMQFHDERLEYHPNAMSIHAFSQNGEMLYENTYYSIGGGFVVDHVQATSGLPPVDDVALPYNFDTAVELLSLCKQHNMRISELMMANELVWRSEQDVRDRLWNIWKAMCDCIDQGLTNEGILPGGLNVKRRARKLHQRLQQVEQDPCLIASTFSAMEWVNIFALAVNEENAAGGRMVTAPTNGAAGIIPAVLHYYMKFQPGACERDAVDFLLTAGAIGILCKKNASISGAEVGCQGEVGSACAMAAAGLAEVMGGTPEQVENAAEIGLEHNLGLTCDPVGGLVQVPCIERNAIATVKAINAAQLGLRGDGQHFISLDKVIRTMRDTGRDMQDKYKETSKGGLAVNTIEC